MPDEITKSELAQLPRWAIVAFAARCARRVEVFAASLPEQHTSAVAKAIEIAEQGAASAEVQR